MTRDELFNYILENGGFQYDDDFDAWYCNITSMQKVLCEHCIHKEPCDKIFGGYDKASLNNQEIEEYKTIYPEYFV